MGPVAQEIAQKLEAEFQPKSLEILNESHLHAGHHGHDGAGETHLRIRIEADAFSSMSRIEMHRQINALVEPFMENGLHAIAIEASKP